MKQIFFTVMVALSVFSPFAGAASEIANRAQAQQMQLESMGVISASVLVYTLDDAIKAIEQKAEKRGAAFFRVIGVDAPERSPYWRVMAEIYQSPKPANKALTQ